MSGIFGIYYSDNRTVDRADLYRMANVLVHRGPDGVDVWNDGPIGMGHRMLWTTPESLLEKLPLLKHELTITADARIDNREELISTLGIEGCPAEKRTDSNLILAAYEKWGEECPEHLLGDFAFAIWDRQKQQLFCARDHFGVKPFYYFFSGAKFIFSSEIKAILDFPDVPRKINETRVADYLISMLEDKSITAYQDILRLPPAHKMTLAASGNMQLISYWSLDTSREIILKSDEEYADAFRKLFVEAVRCRSRSAFPIGSHLSGGLDSSSVTCVARQILKSKDKQLHTFSNVFDDVPECDEREFIQPIIDQGDLIPHYVHPDQIGPLSEWQQFFQGNEEPCLIGGNGYLVSGLNQAAKAQNVRVVLDGFDGDTTLSHGSGYFAELAKQGEWEKFCCAVLETCRHSKISPQKIVSVDGLPYLIDLAIKGQWLELHHSISLLHKNFNYSRKFLWFEYGFKPIIPKILKLAWRFLKAHQASQAKTSLAKSRFSLINASFLNRVEAKNRIQKYVAMQGIASKVRDLHYQKINSGGIVQVLEHLDLDAAAWNVEIRHPFMDKRLVEFCLALPSSQKLQQGWSRIVMRRAMEGLLPKKVQWRWGKMNMTPNFLHGLLKINHELIDSIVCDDLGSIQEYVVLEELHTSYKRLIAGGRLDEDIPIVWTSVGLSLWLRQFD